MKISAIRGDVPPPGSYGAGPKLEFMPQEVRGGVARSGSMLALVEDLSAYQAIP
jgi:hypothetical protein